MAHATVNFSLTETRQFRRLVDFMGEVEQYAEAEDDYALRAIVDEARDDLIADSDE